MRWLLTFAEASLLGLVACSTAPLSGTSEVHTSLPEWQGVDTGVALPAAEETGWTTASTAVEDPAPTVLLNEVVALNNSTWDGGDGSWPDWVEIYNASSESVALSRIALRDRSDLVWLGTEGELAPGERYVVLADDRASEGGAHAPFALDSSGDERLTLSVDGEVTDRLAIGQVGRDITWARLPDAGDWAVTALATPNTANDSAPSASFDLTDQVFQFDRVLPIDIQLSDKAIASLHASRLTWVDGSVVFPEGEYKKVQVRLKAYVGSSRTLDQKCGFKVDLDQYEGREWHGLEGLTLNNMVQDVTSIHEVMAYEFFRAMGVPAPQTGYARVSVNGEDYGFYLIVESIDDEFLDRWYGNTLGPLYEGAYGVDLYGYYIDSFEYDQGPDSADRRDLADVVALLDATATESAYAAMQDLFDMDEFLRNMAVEALILHWDGYTTANNYRLYRSPETGKFQIIPWGTDQTFLTAYYGPWSAGGRLFEWCMEIGSCADDYDRILLEASNTMDDLHLDARAEELDAIARPELDTDPRKEFSLVQHDNYVTATISTIQTWPQSVRDQLAAR